jgi:hypothetical protein
MAQVGKSGGNPTLGWRECGVGHVPELYQIMAGFHLDYTTGAVRDSVKTMSMTENFHKNTCH